MAVEMSGRSPWIGRLSGRSMKRATFQRWLALQQPAPLAGPAPGTPVIGSDALLLAAAALGEQAPATPSPGSGVDRLALPEGGASPGLVWDDIPSVGIDESRSPRPAAPATKAAAAAPPVIEAPVLAPGPIAPEGAAAAPVAPMVVDPAQMPEPTTAELLERANAALRAREAELRENERRLAVVAVGAKESLEEIRRLKAECAGWRRQQTEHDAQTEARDAELRELRRMLAECEELLALSRVMLLSLLER